MGKHYNMEFKNKIFNEYLNGQGGSKYLGKKYKDLDEIIEENMSADSSFSDIFRLLVDRVIVHKINGDRHNVKLDIYVNVLNNKISVSMKWTPFRTL